MTRVFDVVADGNLCCHEHARTHTYMYTHPKKRQWENEKGIAGSESEGDKAEMLSVYKNVYSLPRCDYLSVTPFFFFFLSSTTAL